MTAVFRERRFSAQDGLALYFRDYGDATLRATPVLCLAGIGRNSKDFHGIASRLSTSRRVLAMDYRGRGQSAYDPNWQNYQPRTYINDALHLMAVAGVEKVILLGTSLGAILAMLLTSIQPGALAGAILNDMGPEMPADGFKRIRSYIGKIPRQPDRATAIATLKDMFGGAFPDFAAADWEATVDNMFRREPDGGYLLDYDPAIAKPLAEQSDEPPKLWRFFNALGTLPTLALRGALGAGNPVSDVRKQTQRIDQLLSNAEEKLGSGGLSPATAFVSALVILLREGLEAILLLAAIIAYVTKTKRQDALVWVHAGWVAALALGAVTWIAATYFIAISGTSREMTEGVTALIASVMLLYVGYWLHGRSQAKAWSQFLSDQVGAALEKKTLWAMASVSFLAVYRESSKSCCFTKRCGCKPARVASMG